MKHDNSLQPKNYEQYYRLNSVPEALFLLEAECFETLPDTNSHKKSQRKGIFWEWVLLTILLFIAGFHVNEVENTAPASKQITNSDSFPL